MKLLINDKLSISKESRRLKLLGFSSLHTYFQRPDLKFAIFILWKCIWLKIYILKMLFHKEYYTIVLCYTGYWWQQTSRLLYVQSWRYIRKDQPTIEEENTFFFHFQPVCSPPWNVFAELVAFVKLTTKVIFMQSCGGNFDWFGLLWQFRVHEFPWICITTLSSIQFSFK